MTLLCLFLLKGVFIRQYELFIVARFLIARRLFFVAPRLNQKDA